MGCQLHYLYIVSAEQLSGVVFLVVISFHSLAIDFLIGNTFVSTGHLFGVAASWVVQILIETYRCLLRKPVDEDDDADRTEKIRLLRKKINSATVKCGSSLVFASIGAGIGALFHPSTGQWIGKQLKIFIFPFFS